MKFFISDTCNITTGVFLTNFITIAVEVVVVVEVRSGEFPEKQRPTGDGHTDLYPTCARGRKGNMVK